jgi:hypothetical protein
LAKFFRRDWGSGHNAGLNQAAKRHFERASANCLLPPALHAFSTDRIETERSGKTNLFMSASISTITPSRPEAVGRQLSLVASDITVPILDGSFKIARHARSYRRHGIEN